MKFDDLYNKIVTEIRYRDVSKLNIPGKTLIEPLPETVIYEDVAFHKLPRQFIDYLIDKIIMMKNNKILEKNIDLRNILTFIKQEEVENFKDFFNFIKMLASSNTPKILTIQMGLENSYIEPIELIELADDEYKKIFKDEKYKNYLISKIQNKSYSEALKIMKDNLNSFENLGTLIINPHTITNEMYIYDSDDSVIGHEIRHFLIFLQRWSAVNYEVCKKYSIQPVLNYNRNNPDFKSYSLNEDEFITLSATYIERLINIFLKNKRSLTEKEIVLLIKSVLVKSNSFNIDVLNNDTYWLPILNQAIPQINSIIQFFKNILNDRQYKFINNIKTKKDKFNTLINWTLKSFYEKIKEIKNNRIKNKEK